MKKVHCSLSYHSMPLDELESFALGIKDGYYGHNPPFTVTPVPVAAFDATTAAYVAARGAYVNGGLSQKGPFLLAKKALIDNLDSLAVETDKVANGDSAIIILAGYTPTKTPGEGAKPGQCVVSVKKGIAGELISTCAKVEGAKHYGCILLENAPLPDDFAITADGRIAWHRQNPAPAMAEPAPEVNAFIVDLNDQREKRFTGLKHDVTYYFYYYAVNAKGVGLLSEVVSIVCW